jgi:hypothetical protein
MSRSGENSFGKGHALGIEDAQSHAPSTEDAQGKVFLPNVRRRHTMDGTIRRRISTLWSQNRDRIMRGREFVQKVVSLEWHKSIEFVRDIQSPLTTF